MVKSTTAANVTTNSAASGSVANPDGSVFVAPRPAAPEFLEGMQRQASGLPPAGAQRKQPVPVPDGPVLPLTHVARQFVGREVQRLKAQAEGIERELARGVMGANGMQVPYLIEKQARDRAALAEIRAEIARLSGLSDLEVRKLAYEMGAR